MLGPWKPQAVRRPRPLRSAPSCSVRSGAAGCAKVYSEKVSGARTDRPELAKLLRRLEEGDVLMVTRLDRLARSTRDLPRLAALVAKQRCDERNHRRAICGSASTGTEYPPT